MTNDTPERLKRLTSFAHSSSDERKRQKQTYAVFGIALLILGGVGGAVASYFYWEKNRLSVEISEIHPPTAQAPYDAELPYGELFKALESAKEINDPTDEQFEEFASAIETTHYEIFEYVASRIDLDPAIKEKILERVATDRLAVAEVYFKEMRGIYKSPEYLPEQTAVFTHENLGVADTFNQILSEKLCDVAITTFSLSAKNAVVGSAADFLHTPCTIISTEVLRPVVKKMEEEAIIRDYVSNEQRISKHVRSMLIELATTEDDFETSYNLQFSREFLFFTSEANLHTSVNGTVKAGFDLMRYFSYEINNDTREFIVTLPEPEILSVDLDHRIDWIDQGILAKIDRAELNEAYRGAKETIRLRAIESGILEKARENARDAVGLILGPIAETPRFRYKVTILFQGNSKPFVEYPGGKGLG